MSRQSGQGGVAKAQTNLLQFDAGPLQEPFRELEDVIAPIPERWKGEVHHVQAIEEILAEAPGLGQLAEVPVGGGD